MVKIVTDSSCDISPQRCAELGVEMLPITVNFGDQSYRASCLQNIPKSGPLGPLDEIPYFLI